MILVTDQALVANWVMSKLPMPIDFGSYAAFGFHRNGRMACGAVFNNYRRMFYGDAISVCFAGEPGSLTRPVLRTFFSYVFGQPRMVRLESACSVKHKEARALNERVGFVQEGVSRKGWDGRTNAIHWRMLRSECRWLGSGRAAPDKVVNEQISASASPSS